MKKLSVLISIVLLIIASNSSAQIKINSSGKVGIGVNPISSNILDVNGTVRFTTGTVYGSTGMLFTTYYTDGILDPLYNGTGIIGYTNIWKLAYINSIWTAIPVTVSDEKIKEQVTTLNGALETVLKLRGVQYNLNPNYFLSKDSNGNELSDSRLPLKNRIGFIAQELEKVLPDLVVYDSIKQIHGIIYENVIPILVEAIKEQQKQIASQELKLEELAQQIRNSNNSKKSSIGTPENILFSSLDQNVPNPFTEESKIDFFIQKDAQKAMLYIYTLTGLQIKAISISQREFGSVYIKGSELQAGIYLYMLMVDNKEVDTKRMILTK